MNIQEIKTVLGNISFAPSNLDMGWNWDVKSTKIYNDDKIVLEDGFCIRTTFMRPDVISGEIEKGYGRWMYIPKNISMDGLVKTGWVCAELIVKHELMESFLYENKRIFNPHKSIKDLQYDSNNVDENVPPVVNSKDSESNEEVSTENPTQKIVKEASNLASKDVRDPKVVRDGIVSKEKGGDLSSDEIFHKQNIGNHNQEIREYLNLSLEIDNKNNFGEKVKYKLDNLIVFLGKEDVTLTESNGKVIGIKNGTQYTLSDVKEMLSPIIEDFNKKKRIADPAIVNQIINSAGFTDGYNKEDLWIFKHPKIDHRLIAHSEIDKSLAIINQNSDVVISNEKEMVYEGENYNENIIRRVIDSIAKK